MNTRKEEDGGDEIIEFDEFLKSLSITARGSLDEKLSCKLTYNLYGVNILDVHVIIDLLGTSKNLG